MCLSSNVSIYVIHFILRAADGVLWKYTFTSSAKHVWAEQDANSWFYGIAAASMSVCLRFRWLH